MSTGVRAYRAVTRQSGVGDINQNCFHSVKHPDLTRDVTQTPHAVRDVTQTSHGM